MLLPCLLFTRSIDPYRYASEVTTGCADVFRAAGTGAVAPLRKLIAMGTALNVINPEGQTPLMLATAHGHAVAVSVLLAGGADANVQVCVFQLMLAL